MARRAVLRFPANPTISERPRRFASPQWGRRLCSALLGLSLAGCGGDGFEGRGVPVLPESPAAAGSNVTPAPIAPPVTAPSVTTPAVATNQLLPVAPVPSAISPATELKPTTPLIGGTLLVTRSGQFAIAAAPSTGTVYVVDLQERALVAVTSFSSLAAPTQMAEDAQGRVHIVLRGVGAIATLDLQQIETATTRATPSDSDIAYATGQQTSVPLLTPTTRAVCAAPRGIAYDEVDDSIVVACKSGELAWFTALEPTATRQVKLDLDLRDVVVHDDGILVSTFKNAKVMVVDRSGNVERTLRPNTVSDESATVAYEPHVSQRMVTTSSGQLVVQHQRASRGALGAGYYNTSGCSGGVSHNTFSVLQSGATQFKSAGVLPGGVMLDFAISDESDQFAVLATADGQTALYQGSFAAVTDDAPAPCEPAPTSTLFLDGQVVSAAFDHFDRLLLLRQNPAALEIVGTGPIPLGRQTARNDGMDLFYRPTVQGVACATCHPEGEEDGVTWAFVQDGMRRTQHVAAPLSQTAPLHWNGDRADMTALLEDTLVTRMRSTLPEPAQIVSLASFMEGLPRTPPPVPREAAGVAEGRAVFEQLGCDGCHSGELLTDNQNHDVGTGGSLQTPSLVGVVYRSPFMHDGCAKTLRERFSDYTDLAAEQTSCGGDERHGAWQTLQETQLDQLINYLSSL